MLERLFKLDAHGTTVRKEMIAGLITFLTMSYILFVNPIILGEAGMEKAALFTGTALASVIGTLLMAFLANIPVAQAPGMGLNSFFATTVVLTMGHSWQFALTAVFIQGIIFVALTFSNVRKVILDSIPQTLKNAIPVGIGLFITFIGMKQAGIIVTNPFTAVSMGDMGSKEVWVALLGLVLTGVLLARNVPGAILISILGSTGFALLLGVAHIPEGALVSAPPSIAPIFCQFDWSQVWSWDMLLVVFTLLMLNLFDSLGTLIGVAVKAGWIDKDGNFPQARKALFADALGTAAGSIIGVSTVTSYVESASGVAAGGRTGLTAVSTSLFFIIAMFFSPIFLIVPAQATAPVLIIVGLFMLSSVLRIDFSDYTESIPAFLTIIMMPFTYSISHGIEFGILSYILLKMFTFRFKDISLAVYVIGAFFIVLAVVNVMTAVK